MKLKTRCNSKFTKGIEDIGAALCSNKNTLGNLRAYLVGWNKSAAGSH